MILNWIGLILGMAAILGGALLEGLHLQALIQPTAAIIVFGGTIGATMLASTTEEFGAALKIITKVYLKPEKHDFSHVIKDIIDMANIARKEGILALEKKMGDIKNPFFHSNLQKVVDGYDPTILREMMEERIFKTEGTNNSIGKVWETAGGFAPTIGIIGAILGLIHVMGNLTDSSKLGTGIAVAFVATVYGVGSANLIFIPMGNKIKKILMVEVHEMEIIMTGILGIQAGLNPRIIEDKMNNLAGDHGHTDKGQGEKKAA